MCPRLLAPELIAGKQEEPQLGVFARQLHHLGVVSVCLASLGGHIDHNTDLASVPAHVHILTIDIFGRKLVDGSRIVRATFCQQSNWSKSKPKTR